tara:strand:- start:51252 stop:51593 length:342 start_codon:yes stop_codon:yes gene_type:complete
MGQKSYDKSNYKQSNENQITPTIDEILIICDYDKMNQAQLNQLSQEQLVNRVQALKEICDTINPYLPLTDEAVKKLESFNIEISSDPFHLTNQLLALVDNSVEELEKRKNIRQ